MQIFNEFERKLFDNNSQLALNKYGRNLMFPHSRDCAIRRDYIQHRLGAAFQQMSFLRKIAESHAKRYENSLDDKGEKLNSTVSAINQLSYCFDNLIFNLASLSDYFGNYLGLYLYGPNFQTIHWNGFVKKSRKLYAGNDFLALVSKEHKEWFNRLHNYRGDIIHRKAILVEVVGFENNRYFPEAVERLEFQINDALKRYFVLFKKDENQGLLYFAERICFRTLDGLFKILDASELIEFDDSYKRFKS